MFQLATPLTILQQQTAALLAEVPRVFDGDIEGVHRARIATRRIREVLPLTKEWHPRNAEDDLTSRFKAVGRALGRVRDVDIQIALLSGLETHLPYATPSLNLIRQQQERERVKLLRRLIKRVERLDVDRLLRRVAAYVGGSVQPWTAVAGDWRRNLRQTLIERAHTARGSIAHATGVYFPKRAHATRVALKKFRYAAEIGHITGVGDIKDAIRTLKKGQDVLGELHDRQVLLDTLPTVALPREAQVMADHVPAVVDALDAQCRELHRQYLSRRARLLEICDQTQKMFARRRAGGTAITLGTVAISSGLYVWRRRAPARGSGAPTVGTGRKSAIA